MTGKLLPLKMRCHRQNSHHIDTPPLAYCIQVIATEQEACTRNYRQSCRKILIFKIKSITKISKTAKQQRFPVLSSRNRNTETLGSSLLSESELVSKSRIELSRNRSRNRNSDIPSLAIRNGIESQRLQVSESEPEPESKFSVSRIFPLIATPVLL